MAKKIHTLVISGRRNYEVTGDIDYLQKYYSVKASTIKSLVNKVQAKYSEREAACYNRTFIHLKETPK